MYTSTITTTCRHLSISIFLLPFTMSAQCSPNSGQINSECKQSSNNQAATHRQTHIVAYSRLNGPMVCFNAGPVYIVLPGHNDVRERGQHSPKSASYNISASHWKHPFAERKCVCMYVWPFALFSVSSRPFLFFFLF